MASKKKTVKKAKSPVTKKAAKTIKSPSSQVVSTLALQSLLLGNNELLVYKDEEGEFHIMSKSEYIADKDYDVIFMTYEDI
jgi:hypothetical protein